MTTSSWRDLLNLDIIRDIIRAYSILFAKSSLPSRLSPLPFRLQFAFIVWKAFGENAYCQLEKRDEKWLVEYSAYLSD